MSARRDAMERRDLLWLGALAAGLLALFVWPTLSRSYPVGVGSDFTVYLWWARVAAARGLSVIGGRPGSPALIDAAGGTLHLPLVATVAGLQYAVAASAGPAAAALVRGRVGGGRIASWLLAGALAGVFATHLGSGYLATLGFAICFLAACAALAAGTSRGAVAAALLLGGGGLLHPLFFLVGAVVLGIAAGWAWAERRRSESLGHLPARTVPLRSLEEGRIAVAVLGGAAVIGAGLLSMLAGPARIAVDTSKDAFLRRIGLGRELRHEYRDRFHGIGIRIDILTEIAASVVGAFRVEGTARRILASWLAVTMVGIPVGVITGWFPAVRVLTFAFVLPILAGAGIVRIGSRTPGHTEAGWERAVTLAVVAGIVVLATLPQLLTWRTTKSFVSPQELAAGATIGHLASSTPPGTSIVLVIGFEGDAAFRATNDANILRATVPPERAGDVYVFVGAAADLAADHPTAGKEPTEARLSADSLDAIPDGPRAVFLVRPFLDEKASLREPGFEQFGPGIAAMFPPAPPGSDTAISEVAGANVRASSAAAIAGATLALFLLLVLLGAGWGRWALGGWAGIATAPAFGAAALSLSAVLLERLGVPLNGSVGPSLAAVFAAAVGYGLLLLQGAAGAEPGPDVA